LAGLLFRLLTGLLALLTLFLVGLLTLLVLLACLRVGLLTLLVRLTGRTALLRLSFVVLIHVNLQKLVKYDLNVHHPNYLLSMLVPSKY
jgi:hypothetical protein